MVSVMAVKIQFSSPRGVLLSFSLPGILQVGGKKQVGLLLKTHIFLRYPHVYTSEPWSRLTTDSVSRILIPDQELMLLDKPSSSKLYYTSICLEAGLPDKGTVHRQLS